jgi:hypothetical protein
LRHIFFPFILVGEHYQSDLLTMKFHPLAVAAVVGWSSSGSDALVITTPPLLLRPSPPTTATPTAAQELILLRPIRRMLKFSPAVLKPRALARYFVDSVFDHLPPHHAITIHLAFPNAIFSSFS